MLVLQRMMADHELQRQRVAEGVKLQEESHSRHEMERLRVEQMIQAERKSSEAYSVSCLFENRLRGSGWARVQAYCLDPC